MKRKVILLGIISVFFVIGGLFIVLFSIKEQPTIGKFSLALYQWDIENFSYNENVGEVNNSNIAIEKTKKLSIKNLVLWMKKPIILSIQEKLKFRMILKKSVGILIAKNHHRILLAVFYMPLFEKMEKLSLFGLMTDFSILHVKTDRCSWCEGFVRAEEI